MSRYDDSHIALRCQPAGSGLSSHDATTARVSALDTTGPVIPSAARNLVKMLDSSLRSE